jgi:hypothetical protein
MMEHLSKWLEATWLSEYLSSTSWIVPAVQSIHILGVALVFASMSMLSLRLLGFFSARQPVSAAALPALSWLWPAFLVLLLTGLVMVVAEPERELLSQTFLLKMALVAVAAVASSVLRRSMLRHRQSWDAPQGHAAAKVLGILFFVLWVAIIVCGRWIAYTQ